MRGVDRADAEASREDPVVRRGRAASLDVAEHHGARLVAGALLDLLLEQMANAAEPLVAELVEIAARPP